jgi:hypothetical protein
LRGLAAFATAGLVTAFFTVFDGFLGVLLAIAFPSTGLGVLRPRSYRSGTNRQPGMILFQAADYFLCRRGRTLCAAPGGTPPTCIQDRKHRLIPDI